MTKTFVTAGGSFDETARAVGLQVETFEGERGYLITPEQNGLLDKKGVRITATRGTTVPGVVRAELLDWDTTRPSAPQAAAAAAASAAAVAASVSGSKPLIVTKIAERGNKFDENGSCISSHNRSIVFLPHGVKPGELVRVVLIPLKDNAGAERKDRNGYVMYRAEWALPKGRRSFARTISDTARMLRSYRALPNKGGEAVLRTWFGVLPPECTGHDWYYFGEEHVCYGSRFPSAALLLFEQFPNCSESAFVELLAWLADAAYYKKRQSGQAVGWDEAPDLSDEKMERLLAAGDTILGQQLA